MNLTNHQIERYSRHIILPEIGGKGQEKLLKAKVFCIGAGGLGSPIALYLAAAGVGTIGIIDDDVVDLSNLQRQILHSTKTVDLNKVDSAKATLSALNPDININPIKGRISSENILELIKEYDIILDGSDNFPTRFLVNDACFFSKKTLISGSIFRFEGQLTTIKPHLADNPCYRCLYPEPPPAGMIPSCQEAGVLGVLAGTIGVLQATEAIKDILGIGEPLSRRLLIYDALDMDFREVKTKKDPKCVLCGPDPKITKLIDYEQSCTI
jgi:molybdopterin/thiamine biosynthesis adenylyltransferase